MVGSRAKKDEWSFCYHAVGREKSRDEKGRYGGLDPHVETKLRETNTVGPRRRLIEKRVEFKEKEGPPDANIVQTQRSAASYA